jgi:hypothetical protein
MSPMTIQTLDSVDAPRTLVEQVQAIYNRANIPLPEEDQPANFDKPLAVFGNQPSPGDRSDD